MRFPFLRDSCNVASTNNLLKKEFFVQRSALLLKFLHGALEFGDNVVRLAKIRNSIFQLADKCRYFSIALLFVCAR